MADFKYEKLKKNRDNPKKWYVTYTIKYSNGVTKYPKVYGGEYDIRLNDFSDSEEHEEKLQEVYNAVKNSLEKGEDPKKRVQIVQQQILEEKRRAMGVTYDEAYQIMVDYHNWDDPLESQKLTAHNNKIWFNAQFRRFVEELGKTDDVREITSDDLTNIIIKQNAANKWNITTCITKLGAMGYFFTPLVEAKKISVSPCAGVTNIRKKLKRTTSQKPKKNRFEIWTEQELDNYHKIGYFAKTGQLFRFDADQSIRA